MSPAQLDEFNQQLQVLALTAQQYQPSHPKRQAALRKLVNGILKSGRLCRPQTGNFRGMYEDIYAVAKQELFYYMCRDLDKYDPEKGKVMTWVNMLLTRRFFPEAIPRVLGRPDTRRVTLADLENFAAPEEEVTLCERLREVVEADPEGLFQSAHIRYHPETTFQALFLRRLSGQRWEDIATEFGIPLSTAQTFFSRQLQNFSPKLREYCPDSFD